MLESEIEKRLVKLVREAGGRAYKFVSPGNVGVPDRIVVLPGGRIWFVELKTETGRISPAQERQLETMKSLGANVFVLRGVDGLRTFKGVIK